MAAHDEPRLLVCLTGPESCGKTALAEGLADALGVPLVPEAARAYLAGRSSYGRADVLAIAREQLEAERAALAQGAATVVCDTDLLVIRVWWEEKYGRLDPWLAQELARRTPRRYLLATPDLPWQPDPLRESPGDRQRLLGRYREALAAEPHPHVEIWGQGAARLELALAAVRGWQAELGIAGR